jgi:hypothetical protein
MLCYSEFIRIKIIKFTFKKKIFIFYFKYRPERYFVMAIMMRIKICERLSKYQNNKLNLTIANYFNNKIKNKLKQ